MTDEVALIVGGGPGISASCARLFRQEGMQVAIAARTPNKPVLKALEDEYGVRCYQSDASDPNQVEELFATVQDEIGLPKLVVHNIDGRSREIFRKGVAEAEPSKRPVNLCVLVSLFSGVTSTIKNPASSYLI